MNDIIDKMVDKAMSFHGTRGAAIKWDPMRHHPNEATSPHSSILLKLGHFDGKVNAQFALVVDFTL